MARPIAARQWCITRLTFYNIPLNTIIQCTNLWSLGLASIQPRISLRPHPRQRERDIAIRVHRPNSMWRWIVANSMCWTTRAMKIKCVLCWLTQNRGHLRLCRWLQCTQPFRMILIPTLPKSQFLTKKIFVFIRWMNVYNVLTVTVRPSNFCAVKWNMPRAASDNVKHSCWLLTITSDKTKTKSLNSDLCYEIRTELSRISDAWFGGQK